MARAAAASSIKNQDDRTVKKPATARQRLVRSYRQPSQRKQSKSKLSQVSDDLGEAKIFVKRAQPISKPKAKTFLRASESEVDAHEDSNFSNCSGLEPALMCDDSPMSADSTAAPSSPNDNSADDSDLINDEVLAEEISDITKLKDRIGYIVVQLTELRKKYDSEQREKLLKVLKNDIALYYGYSLELVEYLMNLFSISDAIHFFEAVEEPRPTTIRTNTLKIKRKELARLLINRQCNVDVLGDWTKVGLKVVSSAVPVGATPEYCSGYYMIQSASSLLPVMALAPQPNELVLDMAAAPGGKSTYISQLMQNTGTLFCNDSKKDRIAALSANLHRIGASNAIVMCLDGLDLRDRVPPVDRVLLDAPCSGLGVISKDPTIKARRSVEEFKTHAELQKKLLLTAIDLVNPQSKTGGYVVYSTCSLSVEENEEVINYALKNRDVKLVPMQVDIGLPAFTSFQNYRFHASLKHARRIYPHVHNMDGFFYCKLKKLSNTAPKKVKKDRNPHNLYVKDWGPEKWTSKYTNVIQNFE